MKKLIFITNNSLKLGKQVAQKANLLIGRANILKSAEGEILVRLKESVRGKEVYVLGSTFPPAENLLEFLILINTLKINKPKKIIAIVSYYGYAKADRTDRPGWSVTARLAAQFIETAGANEFIGITLHSERIEKFFKIPTHHLDAISLLAGYFKSFNKKDLAIASPDFGGIKRAKNFAKILGINNIVVVEKKRPTEKVAVISKITGDFKNKNIILVDDMIQSGNTIIENVKILKAQGAKKIYVTAAHITYSGNPIEKLKKANIKEIIITDTIAPPNNLPKKFKIISTAKLISDYLINKISL